MRNVRRKQVEDNRKKRRIVYLTFGTLLFVYLTLNLIAGDNGLLKYRRLAAIKNSLQAETLTMQRQNQEAKELIEAIKKEPERVEELARDYGMTKEGELVFKFEDRE